MEYITFKTFPDKATAESFAEILKEKGIAYTLEEDALQFDPSYANNPLQRDYLLKIRQNSFPIATKAYESYFAALLDDVEDDYYLFSFSNEELTEILAKPDEWGSFDYLLAQRLMQERGVAIPAAEQQRLKEKRLQELSRPEKETVANVLGYYLLSVLFFPLGIVIGWTWRFAKKTLPNGQRVYTYDGAVRNHGKNILTLSLLLFLLTILWKVLDTLPLW